MYYDSECRTLSDVSFLNFPKQWREAPDQSMFATNDEATYGPNPYYALDGGSITVKMPYLDISLHSMMNVWSLCGPIEYTISTSPAWFTQTVSITE